MSGLKTHVTETFVSRIYLEVFPPQSRSSPCVNRSYVLTVTPTLTPLLRFFNHFRHADRGACICAIQRSFGEGVVLVYGSLSESLYCNTLQGPIWGEQSCLQYGIKTDKITLNGFAKTLLLYGHLWIYSVSTYLDRMIKNYREAWHGDVHL